MTTSFAQTNNQDSISYREFVIQDTLKTSTDSANAQISIDTVSHEIENYEADVVVDSSISVNTINAAPRNIAIIRKKEIDTVSVCYHNPVADIIFTSSDYIHVNSVSYFPFQFVQKNNEMLSAKREHIEKSLKNGETLPITPFRNDWIIGIVILSIILFSIVYDSVKTLFPNIARFFLFRITKEEKKNQTEVFHWKSVILNLSSLFIISIFAYFAILYRGIISNGLSEFTIWLLSAVTIAVAVTLRHFICAITGMVSGATEIFNDYIITVYQAYRFTGFFLSVLVVLFLYTPLIAAESCLITGCIIIAILYLIRISRLFLLFINYKVSIFYLILYLCALEILPVLLSIKYFSGLI